MRRESTYVKKATESAAIAVDAAEEVAMKANKDSHKKYTWRGQQSL